MNRWIPPKPSLTLRRACVLCVLALLAWGTTAWAQPLVLRDDRGTEHRFDALPQRIVTLLPSLTETAWVLGVGPRLVGVDRFSNWPADIAALPRLGGLDDAQIEALAR
jgi:iron complex transport system substrate-binding protein